MRGWNFVTFQQFSYGWPSWKSHKQQASYVRRLLRSNRCLCLNPKVCLQTYFFFYGKSRQVSNLTYKRSLWLLCAKTGAVADGWWKRDADLNFKWTCLLWPRTSNTYKTKQNCIPQVLTSSNCIYLEGSKSCRAVNMAQILCCLSTSNGFWHISPQLSGIFITFEWLQFWAF